MKTINLAAPWSFHSIELTIDYPAGSHEVSDAVHAKARADGVIGKDEGNGDGTANAGAAIRSRAAEK